MKIRLAVMWSIELKGVEEIAVSSNTHTGNSIASSSAATPGNQSKEWTVSLQSMTSQAATIS